MFLQELVRGANLQIQKKYPRFVLQPNSLETSAVLLSMVNRERIDSSAQSAGFSLRVSEEEMQFLNGLVTHALQLESAQDVAAQVAIRPPTNARDDNAEMRQFMIPSLFILLAKRRAGLPLAPPFTEAPDGPAPG